jgi:hypothetical protein
MKGIVTLRANGTAPFTRPARKIITYSYTLTRHLFFPMISQPRRLIKKTLTARPTSRAKNVKPRRDREKLDLKFPSL